MLCTLEDALHYGYEKQAEMYACIVMLCARSVVLQRILLLAMLIVCRQQLAVAQEPKHQVRQITNMVLGFKPVARHKEHVSDSFDVITMCNRA